MAYLDRDDARPAWKMTPLGWLILLVVTAGAGIIGRSVVRELMSGSSGDSGAITAQLTRASDELNRRVPLRIDAATTLERTEVLGQTLVYHYSVDGPTIMDTSAFATQMGRAVQERACGDAMMREAIQAGARFRFIYRDSAGVLFNRTVQSCYSN